jgi:hypothetical protein
MFNRCSASALALIWSLVIAGAPAFAQNQPSAAAPAAKPAKAAAKSAKKAEPADPAAAQASIDSGVAAYNAGKTDQAVASLSSALSGGKLPAAQTARALYYRGIAYRKQGKPAQAIADLTSALWLKNGLGPTEKADATAQRSAAYREAGLPDQTDGSGAPKAAPAAIAQPASPATPTAPAQKAAAAVAPSAAPKVAAVATAPAVPAGPVAPKLTAAPPSPPAAVPPQPVPASVKTAALATPSSGPAAATSSGSGIGNFFGNLFGGSSPKPAEPKAAPAQPQTSGWSEKIEVKRGATTPLATAAVSPPAAAVVPPQAAARIAAPATPVAAAAPAAPPAAPRASAATKTAVAEPTPATARPTDPYSIHQRPASPRYQLQVAAVRSKAEAQAIYDRIRQQHSKDPGFREAVIDEAAVGGVGTFYRVRLGPYAEVEEPRTLCSKLRTSGVDCMIVAP